MVDEFVVKNGLISPSVDGGAITSTSLNVNGLVYPSTDGDDGQVIETDGAGNLTFQTPTGGGGGATEERFRLNYATTGDSDSTDNLSSGVSSAVITAAAAGFVDVIFSGHTYPPTSIVSYGYDYATNVYRMNSIGYEAMGGITYSIAGGGSSGSPTAFGAFAGITLSLDGLSEGNTGAGRDFGTTTHAWIMFIFGD